MFLKIQFFLLFDFIKYLFFIVTFTREKRTIKYSQNIAFNKATDQLCQTITTKINSIFSRTYSHYGISAPYNKELNEIKNQIKKEIKLENTKVKPEGYIYVVVSANFHEIRTSVKNSILSNLKHDAIV